MRKIIFIYIILFCVFSFSLFAQYHLPDIKAEKFLIDTTNVFSKQEQDYLVQKLQKIARESGSLIVVGAFVDLPEDTYLEDFSTKLFEKWKPGSGKDNNGILIVFFKNDRKIRIEVGYGLEHLVTDLQAGRVIDDYIIPQFRKGDYFAGINNGIDVLASAVKGEYTIPIKAKSKKSNWVTLFVIFFVIISIFRRFGGRGTTISKKGSRYSRTTWGGPFFFGGGGGGSSFGGGGGGFSGGFGGLSGGGGASGSW